MDIPLPEAAIIASVLGPEPTPPIATSTVLHYQHVGDDLEGYLYQRIVQIFQGTELLAADPRARRKAEWHTRSEHYRPHKAALQGNTPERCREMARKVPPATAVVLASLLLERPLDQQCSGQVVLR